MTRDLRTLLSIWMLITLSRLCQCAGVSQVPARGPPGLTRMYRKDLLSPVSPAGLRNGIGKHESNAHDVSVCRGHMRSITCPNLELLHIFNAFYGKLSGHDCETPIAQFRDQMPTCFAKDAPNIIRQTCQGQQSCDLYAEDSLYNNPCPSVKKYLYVSFTCQGKSRLPEILKMFHEKQRAQRRYQIHQQEILKFAQKQREDAQKKSQLYLQQQKQQYEQQRLQNTYRQRQELEQRQLATQELAIRKQQQAQRQMEQQAFAQRQQIAARKAEEKARAEEMKQRMVLQQRQQVMQQQQQQLQQRMQEQMRQQMQQQMQRQQIVAQHAAMPQPYPSTMLRGSVTQPQRTNAFSFYPYQHMMPPPQPAPLSAPALPPMPAQAAIPLSSLTPQSAAAAGGYLRQFIQQAPQYLRRTPVAHPVLAGRPAPRPQYLVRPQPAQARFLPQPRPQPKLQPKHATERYLSPLPPPPQLGRTGVPYAPPVPAKHAPPQAKTSVPLTSSVPVLPVTSIKYSPLTNVPPAAPLLPKVVPQLPIARGALPPPGWQAKPDIKFYEKQVGNALNSLYRLYSNNKCDKCNGDCNNFRCWGCGGCALPSLEKHQTIAPWHPPTNDAATLDKRMLFNRVKEAMLRQHVNYYPPKPSPYQSPTSRSNVTQPLDAKKQYWANQNTQHRGETFWPFYGKAFLGPFTPSLFKKQAQAYAAAARPPQFHRRAWSYQGKEWPHERNIPITPNMWLAVRDNVASNENGVPADDQESVVRTADGLTFQYHDAFANNAMALSGLVLYPFPKRNKKKTIPIPPKRRSHEGSNFETFDMRRSKVKRLPDKIRQILGMKRSKLPKEAKRNKKKKKGRHRRSVEEEDRRWYNKEEEWSPELMKILYEIT